MHLIFLINLFQMLNLLLIVTILDITGTLEILDLSNNKLQGTIPWELGQLDGASVILIGNDNL